ncbi:nuclear transport factor 2 family protein [Aquimarina algiphila]|uniref:nuclear transport factor 2 family protein n=1 Tax=Aquimarina algiphila TaxID=2047982 RepID=UPI00232CAF07|nr:DUF4440 domain-containing protein [Aquimarina algiphila]
MKIILKKSTIWVVIVFITTQISTYAQSNQNHSDQKPLKEIILTLDGQFWKAYNTCDIENFKTFFIDDFEFYHDKGGLTSGLSKMMKLVETGLCGKENPRLRREVVENSVNVYPLNNYGAIISGEHVFYITEKGKQERLIEIAKFTHVWQHKNQEWKMTRVLSYDHQPAPQNTDKKEISISDEILTQYVGTYEAPKTGTVSITKKEHLLEIKAGKMQAIVYPQSENHFFHKQSPLSFEFIKNAEGNVDKFIARENGAIVEEAKKIK